MDSVLLNADYSTPLYASICPRCHGVWMRSLECRTYLGLECEKLSACSQNAPLDLECPHCQTSLHTVSINHEEDTSIQFFICPRCQSCYFDQTQFALIFYLQLKAERDISGVLAQTPLDSLGVCCCDCGAAVDRLEDLHDVGIGYCCKACHSAPPVLTDYKLQTFQLISFHNLEIKIEHFQNSTRSRIAVTPFEPCLFEVRLNSLSFSDRIMRLGHRKLRFHGTLGRHLDASDDIRHLTPFHVFMKQRGVVENLIVLTRLGQIDISFKPHIIAFELNAKRVGTETKLRFETAVRRILIAYERFVLLAKDYKMPDDEEDDVKKD